MTLSTTAQASPSSTSRSISGSSSSGQKGHRYDTPPTWKGSAIRAVIAAAVVYALSTLLINKHVSASSNLVIVPIVLLLYTPMIFYTDNFMYKRRQRRKSSP